MFSLIFWRGRIWQNKLRKAGPKNNRFIFIRILRTAEKKPAQTALQEKKKGNKMKQKFARSEPLKVTKAPANLISCSIKY